MLIEFVETHGCEWMGTHAPDSSFSPKYLNSIISYWLVKIKQKYSCRATHQNFIKLLKKKGLLPVTKDNIYGHFFKHEKKGGGHWS